MISKKKLQQNGNVLSEKTLHKFSNNQVNAGDVNKNGHVDRDPSDKSSKSDSVGAPKKINLPNRSNQHVQQNELYPKQINSPLQ